MRAVLLSLLRRLRSHLSYRAATQRLNTSFRDVQPAALAATPTTKLVGVRQQFNIINMDDARQRITVRDPNMPRVSRR